MIDESTMTAQGIMPAIAPCGDSALTVEFAQAIDPRINARVRALDGSLTHDPPMGMSEAMPTYGSLLVLYDPVLTCFAVLKAEIEKRLTTLRIARQRQTGWCIPVIYGGTHGFDLDAVARDLQIDREEIVQRHAASRFHVYMIGFLPGFTYLGGLDQTIATPRRAVPRHAIPPGSIVIGGKQTAVSSIEGPSGWHVIGRTPVKAFMPDRDPVVFMMPGDRIVLEPLPADAFDDLAARSARGDLVAEPLL